MTGQNSDKHSRSSVWAPHGRGRAMAYRRPCNKQVPVVRHRCQIRQDAAASPMLQANQAHPVPCAKPTPSLLLPPDHRRPSLRQSGQARELPVPQRFQGHLQRRASTYSKHDALSPQRPTGPDPPKRSSQARRAIRRVYLRTADSHRASYRHRAIRSLH